MGSDERMNQSRTNPGRGRGSAVLKAAIVVFWITMTGLLVYREAWQARGGMIAPKLTAQDLASDDAWMGVYFVKQEDGKERTAKIGYVHQTRKDANPGYMLTEDTRLRLTVQGAEKSVRSRLVAAVDRDYRLLSFHYELSSDALKFGVAGETHGSVLDLKIETGAALRRESIPVGGAAALPLNLTERIVAAGVEPGKTFTVDYFDPSTMATDRVAVRVAARETETVGGQAIDVYRLDMAFKGVPIQSWMDARGNVLRERTASMLTLRESKEQALSGGWGKGVPMDMIDLASIRVTRTIDRPREAARVVVRLSGADLSGLPLADDRQTFADGVLTVTREGLTGPVAAIPYTGSDLKEFLKPTPTLQSDDPEIVAKAREIVGGRREALAAAQALADWVNENIEKKPVVSIPSAADVLTMRKGDCNEHAALLTALARAAGIPAKILVGLVYNDGAFYYHAWNALWVGKWVAVDATFGQFPADATHLKVQEGDLDQQIVIARLIGRLRIDVLEER